MSVTPEPSLQEERESMCAMVHALIQRHPLMAPLLEHYRFIQVDAHDLAVWAQVGSDPQHPGHFLQARISSTRWWESGMETRENWARRLTVRLAKELRKAWDRQTSIEENG